MKHLLLLACALLLALGMPAQRKPARPAAPPPPPPAAPDLNAVFKAAPWRNIGPFRGGRSVTACGVPGDPMTYYMGTTGGGLWKTSDAGLSWANISDGFFRTGSVGAVAVAPSDVNVVYAGMGEHAPRGVMTTHGDGVYRSTDAGRSWKHLGLGESRHISELLVHPHNPDWVYVAVQGALYGPSAERGVYHSADGGATWKRLLFVNETTGCADLSMDPSNPRILYAAMWDHQRSPWEVRSGGPGSGLYKSADAGLTWTRIGTGLPEKLGKIGVSVCASNPDRLYALVESDSEQELGGLFVSADAGKSWTRVSADHSLTMRAWYYIEVYADPNDEHTVYVLNAPMLKSIDGGKTWSRIGGTHGDYHDLWINPANSQNMAVANDGGAAVTFNGGKTWSLQNRMPTAQFYRVNADNLFPYHLYGGQQDNSSVRIASRNTAGYTIGEKNWNFSAGGESAFLAFNPDNPEWVMGGSYQGTIEVLNQQTLEGKAVMESPDVYLALAPRDMRYRFNWNAPIICSAHEPNTFYHAGNVLFRTRDRGMTWETVSPDLTRNDRTKQGKSGVPYTNEGAGGENYNTLSYVMESPHEAGVIWTGSDDGLVHLTRDGGASWTNVTPAGLPECLINAIEVSPHDKATAYIATTRYKFNDLSPALYKTSDYGKSWTRIDAGIPAGAFTRVVREDPVRKGLLFAGTEAGLYLSFDGGQQWLSFQSNLPIVPITDLKIHQGDLLAATMGRSFWIFDDLGLLRQWTPGDGPRIFTPEDAYRVSGGSALDANVDTGNPMEWWTGAGGPNPATGPVIYYQLPGGWHKDSAVSLEIRDAAGQLVRSYAAGKGAAPGTGKLPEPKPGISRIVWNLRYPDLPEVPGVYIEGSYDGHKAPPGSYTAVLKLAGQEYKAPIRVLADPRIQASQADYEAQHALLTRIGRDVRQIHEAVMGLRKTRAQLSALKELLAGESSRKALLDSAASLEQAMKRWEEQLIQPKSKVYDDVINFENKLSANLLFVKGELDQNTPGITQGQRARFEELHQQWTALQAAYGQLVSGRLAAFNRLCADAGIGVLYAPPLPE